MTLPIDPRDWMEADDVVDAERKAAQDVRQQAEREGQGRLW